jgi:adenine-specific DNA-methyltransferase
MYPAVQSSSFLAKSDAVICGSIDDTEVTEMREVFSQLYTKQIGIATVRANPQSRKTSGKFSPVHEYAVFYGRTDLAQPSSIGFSQKKAERYPLVDEQGHYAWMNFVRAGNADLRTDRPKSFYPIWVLGDGKVYVPKLRWNEGKNAYDVLEDLPADAEEVYPTKSDGGRKIEKRWQRGHERFRKEYAEYRARRDSSGLMNIDFKTRMDNEAAPTTWWDKSEYASSNFGAGELADIVPDNGFDYPKTKGFVMDALRACGGVSKDAVCLDFFAGSGTTGQAVIELNREDQGKRKYILVEQGAYFGTIIKPRMLKTAYSSRWKAGKPTSTETGISHAFKVLKIESYEDTVNNLDLKRSDAQATLLDGFSADKRDDYLMRYMLDVEAQGSLLSVKDFQKPFDYSLRIAVDSAGACEDRKVDLVETFNYLIGLTVRHIDIQLKQGFTTVEGTLPTGEKTLILWRDCEKIGYEALTKLCDKLAINPADSEFEVVYINGDHNIPSVVETSEAEGSMVKKLMLRQIEPAFLDAMFNMDDL